MTAARGPEYYALHEHPPPAPMGGNPQPSPVTADSGPTDTGSLPPVPPPPPQPTPPPTSAASAPGVAPAGPALVYGSPAQGAVSVAPASIAAASAPRAPGGVPVQPAHDSPTPATPAPLVQTPPALATATASPLPTTTSTETAQWSHGEQRVVLILSVLAIILLAVPRFLFSWGGIGGMIANLILSTPIVLLIIGIIQTHRRAAPSALVALGALTPVQALESLSHPFPVFTVVDLGAYAAILTASIICLWGRLPHSRHTPRSTVAVSALAVVLLWRAVVIPAGATITSRLFLNPSVPFHIDNNYLFF